MGLNYQDSTSKARVSAMHHILKSIPGGHVTDTPLNRSLTSAGTGAMTFLLSRLAKHPMPTSAALGAAGATMGYATIPIVNKIEEAINNPHHKKMSNAAIHDAMSKSHYVALKANDAFSEFAKQSGLASTFGQLLQRTGKAAVQGIGKGVAWTGGQIVKGALPAIKDSQTGKVPLYAAARGLVVKGGLVGGAMVGVPMALSKITNPEQTSRPNYTTYMRNNMLRGNIHASQMSPNDVSDVQRLGMR
jgi:hypothetical protein